MNTPNGNESFKYTYSSKEQNEIKKIRQKYDAGEDDKMERLRKLDRSVMQKSTALSLITGVIGALILGFGMSLTMTDLGEALGFGTTLSIVLGIIIGIAGALFVALAYPVYNIITKKERQKVAPEIIRLTDELLK